MEVEFPEQVVNPTDIQIVANGKEVGTSQAFEVDSIPYQVIEVHAVFNMNGENYTTEKTSFTVQEKNNQRIQLQLSTDDLKRISDAEEARKLKEKEAQKSEEEKSKILNFLNEYRSAVFSSVANRSNTYARYYDTQSPAYKDMVDFTTGGGVRRAKIDYYRQGALEIQGITEENGIVTVKTYEDFTVYYVDSSRTSQNCKNKTYTLRRMGDSFVILDIVVDF
ncbi:hypothetical protein STRDD10_00809 [Streptococcus sp. DD10]|uniref:TcaA NTF2-like domain-containing protein n=1 Tax=Streptococcus sp. DD10 TaxID=1777878 RepID=UPI000791B2A3|nr:hypothetical protein [Streptococcus sp. DD10]KXT74598.1 hypothetical protein STRDD10_00809 [Streptococcus sp. DD10]